MTSAAAGQTHRIETRDQDLKASLPAGPWQDEPDKVQWYDETTGMACLIVRQSLGALCGYVGVDPGHPWHGLGYGSCTQGGCDDSWCEHGPGSLTDVHGGLTYSGACQENGNVCHVPAEGREHDVFWFGFDCGHSFDQIPWMLAFNESHSLPNDPEDVYRDLGYVTGEVERLAQQLAAVT